MKEYELIQKYLYPNKSIESPFDLVSQALYTKSTSMLKLDECKAEIAEVFEYIEIKARFDLLFKEAHEKLFATPIEFNLENFGFQTLDEVERALKHIDGIGIGREGFDIIFKTGKDAAGYHILIDEPAISKLEKDED